MAITENSVFENAASAVLFATSQTKQATLQRNDFDRNTAGAVHGLHPLVHAATEGSLPAVGPLGAIGAARAASAPAPGAPGPSRQPGGSGDDDDVPTPVFPQ